MRDGILQQLDTPQSLYDRPANMFVAGFIGSPSMNFFDAKVVNGGGADELYVEVGTLRLKVPSHRINAVKSMAGRDVVFGIRPEDIHHPTERRDAPDHQRANVQVEVVEPLGSEQFVYLKVNNQEFTSRMPARAQLNPDSATEVVFDTEKMHIFDRQTEMAVI
jgi:multiple sugar transport system ATP-binding protein